MKVIRSWTDLEEYGIDLLTGEACAYGYRYLCDVTPAGAELIRNCFGFPVIPQMSEAWNNHGTWSIMLPRDMFEPLAVFALIGAGCKEVIITDDEGVFGTEADDNTENLESWMSSRQLKRVVHNPGFSRHRHAMTGRTE